MNKAKKTSEFTRRNFLYLFGGGLSIGLASTLMSKNLWAEENKDYKALVEEILPTAGFISPIVFGDSILALVQSGAIDPDKFVALYEKRGGLPAWAKELFIKPSTDPILFNAETAPILLNLLWPLGIANKTIFNEKSPLNGEGLANFASTGGWKLSKEGSGADYFNKVAAVPLNSTQEELVYEMATKIYRPCCGNDTFYQDCNHGSALLGLLELGAAQGMTKEDLYRSALAANSYWYPKNYILTSLYFDEIAKTPWMKVSPEVMLSKRYSSLPEWNDNVEAPLKRAGILERLKQGGVSCSA